MVKFENMMLAAVNKNLDNMLCNHEFLDYLQTKVLVIVAGLEVALKRKRILFVR
jgi:hypothetical protein